MNKTKRVFLFAATAILLGSAASVFAQGRPQLAGKPRAVTPLRYARVDSQGHLKGPWIEVKQQNNGGDGTLAVAFDCFEADENSTPPGAPTEKPEYGPPVNPPGSEGQRFFFGPDYQNMFAANDMTVASGMAGALASRVDLAWYWNGQPGERCILVVNTAETFGNSPSGPSFSDPYDGVAYDFGTGLPGAGFFISRVDLTPGLEHLMPTDGEGAYTLIIANEVTKTSITLASVAQPMLWTTKKNNPSFQHEFQWDDDNPVNGLHDAPAEYYDYTYTQIYHRPFGAMIAFYAPGAASQSFPPGSFSLFRGILFSGGLNELAVSDDQRLEIRPGLVLNAAEPPIQLDLTGTSPIQNPSDLKFKLEARGNVGGLVQKILLFDYQANAFVEVDSRNATITDSVVEITATNPARFVQTGTGTVRARITWRPSGPVPFFPYTVGVDQAIWTVSP